MRNHLISTGLRDLKKPSSLLVFLVIFLVPVVGTGSGLYNNDSRTFTPTHEMKPSDWDDPAELERVWQSALVRIPKPDGRFIATTVKDLHTHNLEGSEKFPTVIYLHGCYGLWSGNLYENRLSGLKWLCSNSPAKHGQKKILQVL